jgi:hypothetical protein
MKDKQARDHRDMICTDIVAKIEKRREEFLRK